MIFFRKPVPTFRDHALSGVQLLRIELAQYLELVVGRRFGHAGMGGELQRKTGIVLQLLARNARGERNHLHASFLFVKSEHREIGDYAEHAAGQQTARAPGLAALEKAGAGDEIDVFDETPLLVLHRHDHFRETCDVVAAAGARQARLGVARIADERAVEIAVLVDLRASHEAEIDVAALEQKQHFRAAEHHVGADRATLIVGRGRQLPRLDERADDAAFEQDGQARAAQALCEGRSEERNADAREYNLAVTRRARASKKSSSPNKARKTPHDFGP